LVRVVVLNDLIEIVAFVLCVETIAEPIM
jgi:hypothetical protein